MQGPRAGWSQLAPRPPAGRTGPAHTGRESGGSPRQGSAPGGPDPPAGRGRCEANRAGRGRPDPAPPSRLSSRLLTQANTPLSSLGLARGGGGEAGPAGPGLLKAGLPVLAHHPSCYCGRIPTGRSAPARGLPRPAAPPPHNTHKPAPPRGPRPPPAGASRAPARRPSPSARRGRCARRARARAGHNSPILL
jgi:hypothetical protein